MPRSVKDRIGVFASAKAVFGTHFSIGRILPVTAAELRELVDEGLAAESTDRRATFLASQGESLLPSVRSKPITASFIQAASFRRGDCEPAPPTQSRFTTTAGVLIVRSMNFDRADV